MAINVSSVSVRDAEGGARSLGDWTGQVLLIVNVASKCGVTPQYAGLEQLWRTYRDRGLLVLGFPCDQFGHQEPGDENEIKNFCSLSYDVSFPMFAKGKVKGDEAQPFFQRLKAKTGESPSWNFNKYLVGRDGKPVAAFGSMTAPDGDAITKAVRPGCGTRIAAPIMAPSAEAVHRCERSTPFAAARRSKVGAAATLAPKTDDNAAARSAGVARAQSIGRGAPPGRRKSRRKGTE